MVQVFDDALISNTNMQFFGSPNYTSLPPTTLLERHRSLTEVRPEIFTSERTRSSANLAAVAQAEAAIRDHNSTRLIAALDYGVALNGNYRAASLLHYCVEQNFVGGIALLLQRDGIVSDVSASVGTPLEYAHSLNRTEIVSLLEHAAPFASPDLSRFDVSCQQIDQIALESVVLHQHS
jgi:hypothetical protein